MTKCALLQYYTAGKGKSKKAAGGSAEAGTQTAVTSSTQTGGGAKAKQPQPQPKDSVADGKKGPSQEKPQEAAKTAAAAAAAAELELPHIYLQSTGYLGHVRACPIDKHAYPVHPSLAVPAFTLVSQLVSQSVCSIQMCGPFRGTGV